MKKMGKLLALFIAVLMVASIQLPAMAVEIGDAVTENIPSLKDITGSKGSTGTVITELGETNQKLNASQMMVENDKYIFVAIGMKGQYNFRVCSAIQIFDKETGELLTTITQASGNKTWYCPVRSMHVADDVLYVSWGNAVNSVTAIAQIASPQSPVKAYDVSNVTEGVAPTVLTTIDSGNARAAADAPFHWGGISYLDEENDILYTSKVTSKASGTRYYTASNVADVENGNAPAVQKFHTTGDSINTARFIMKDGWLFEVLKQAGGMTDNSGNPAEITLKDAEGNALNNQVRVYDLRNANLTATTQSVDSYLKGTYTTEDTDNDAIKDIEVAGDYMYLSTKNNGIEVVSLATLTLTTTVAENGIGGVTDIDVIGGSLFAGYEGPEYFKGPNSNSNAGAIVVYDIATNPAAPAKTLEKEVPYGVLQMSANADKGIIYVLNDTAGPAHMAAFTYVPDAIVEEEEFEFTAIKLNGNTTLTAGTFDISVELTNPDVVTGTIICAVYEGNKLADVFVDADYAGATSVTMAEDYVVTGAVTEIKAMFLDSLTGELRPLIPAISID